MPTFSLTETAAYKCLATGASAAMDIAVKYQPIVEKVSFVAFKVFFTYYPLYSLFEASLSNILCLKTFRHGSSPNVLARIHIEGPDLTRGGTGGEANWYKNILGISSPYAARDKGCFYVVEDITESQDNKNCLSFAKSYFTTKMTVKYYAMRTSFSYYGSWLPLPVKWKANITQVFVNVIESGRDGNATFFGLLLSPTIKFHLDPNQVTIERHRSSLDTHSASSPALKGRVILARDGEDSAKGKSFEGALVTRHQFSVLDIGVIGTLKNGLNSSLIQRIKENKGQVMWGIAQLVCFVAQIAILHPTVIPCSMAVMHAVEILATYEKTSTVGSVLIRGLRVISSIPFVMAILEA